MRFDRAPEQFSRFEDVPMPQETVVRVSERRRSDFQHPQEQATYEADQLISLVEAANGTEPITVVELREFLCKRSGGEFRTAGERRGDHDWMVLDDSSNVLRFDINRPYNDVDALECFPGKTTVNLDRTIDERLWNRGLEPVVQERTMSAFALSFNSQSGQILHPDLPLERVVKALEFDPGAMRAVRLMQNRGHEPNVHDYNDEGFYIGTCSKVAPESTMESWVGVKWRDAYVKQCGYFDGDSGRFALEDARDMGLDLMDDDYERAAGLGLFEDLSYRDDGGQLKGGTPVFLQPKLMDLGRGLGGRHWNVRTGIALPGSDEVVTDSLNGWCSSNPTPVQRYGWRGRRFVRWT